MSSNNPPDGQDKITPPFRYTISRVEVLFPVKPYKVQMYALVKIIRCITATTNALLELPTGSGKTLTLLCGTLAWQKHERAELAKLIHQQLMEEARLLEEQTRPIANETGEIAGRIQSDVDDQNTSMENRDTIVECSVENDNGVLRREKQMRMNPEEETSGCCSKKEELMKPQQEIRVINISSDDENIDDFAQKRKMPMKMANNSNKTSKITTLQLKDKTTMQRKESMIAHDLAIQSQSSSQCTVTTGSQLSCCETLPQFHKSPGQSPQKQQQPSLNSVPISQQSETSTIIGLRPRVPKIYYCSRTHAQLKQVVKELRQTVYKDVKMTILSSREHTCIQHCSSARNKNELCKSLLDPVEGPGCMFERNVSRMSSHTALEGINLATPWDIEDLVTAGRKIKACPYFAARELVASADIVFCPYIYLIDPKISTSMKLDISGAIIILDEAHNIEECCREAASYTVSHRELEDALKDCLRVANMNILPQLHNKLATFLENLLQWISERVKCPYVSGYNYDKDKTGNYFSGLEATANLEKHNIKPQDIIEFKSLAQEAIAEPNKEENRGMGRRHPERYGIHPTTSIVLTGLSYVFGFMYNNDMQHLKDYFVVISKTSVLQGIVMRDLPEEFGDSEANESRFGNRSEIRNYFLNFLCMNSAVIFRPISERARSIVLASGTLSPIETYESELGALFPNPLSTSHIIKKDQVFVGAVSQSPNGKVLVANYTQSQSDIFKDELGYSILEICKCVPYGILCFLPSYSLLKNLETRWMRTNLWSQLEEHKIVMCEPQNNREYPAVVEAFQECVKSCEQGFGNGPLLFAVMRGKVSEGMNFADNMARAVISVGIPFPHLHNIFVILKRFYNTTNCSSQKLVSGEMWYRNQAYKAVNQALGRCIRHSKDWGALIMLDERFTSGNGQISGLSKWINENVRIFKSYGPFHSQLKSFIESQMEAETERNKEENQS